MDENAEKNLASSDVKYLLYEYWVLNNDCFLSIQYSKYLLTAFRVVYRAARLVELRHFFTLKIEQSPICFIFLLFKWNYVKNDFDFMKCTLKPKKIINL